MPAEPRGILRGTGNVLFGAYAWIIFVACVLYSLVIVTVVPGPSRRRRLVAAAAKATFLLTGQRPIINGLENLPAGACVVVANHASYVDGILLKGFLPGRFTFVIKGEMRKIPVVHFLLRRGGALFVERFSAHEGARDARQLVRAAKEGVSLGFFPEGTFIEEPGVGRFRAGAFMAAIKGQMPVVPIAIFGTRKMMPSGRILPRPAAIRVEITAPIATDDPTFADHHTLAEQARQCVLAVIDEPDLLAH